MTAFGQLAAHSQGLQPNRLFFALQHNERQQGEITKMPWQGSYAFREEVLIRRLN